MSTAATDKDFLGMSDEDFLKVNPPNAEPAAAAESEDPADTNQQETQPETNQGIPAPGSDAPASGEPLKDETASHGDGAGSDASAEPEDAGAEGDKVQKDQKPQTEAEKTAADKAATNKDGAKDGDKGEKKPEGETEKVEQGPPDYEAFFKQVMTPFKANGRTIELKTPEEAIRLMQMGAGYGRKLQDLQPHLKVLRMLEKNELLDESKLSFLIDINAKNPDAIKKLIKDAGIDPLEINTADNVDYRPTNHSVSDREMAFKQALETVQEHPTGRETLQTINQTWDPESKKLLWEQPEVLNVIQSQREAGVYDQIAAEIDRQKLLGTIPPSTPFLQAYKIAGDHLMATNAFKPAATQTIQTQSAIAPQPQVIATRTAQPKPVVQNSDKAAAASPTKSVQTRKPTSVSNPLAMADDEFLKQFGNRL